MTTPTPDSSLVHDYALRRDALAFAELVRRYTPMVFSVARRVTRDPAAAEDVTQECFFDLARNAACVRGVSVAGWLYRSAVNRAIDHRRSEGSRRARETGAADASHRAEPRSEWAELEPLVDEAIAALPEDLRVPLVQHYMVGQPQADVAAALGVNQSTVSRRLEAAVTALREHLRAAGVMPSVAALPALLLAHGTEAVPASLAANLGRVAVSGITPARASAAVPIKWGTAAAAAVFVVAGSAVAFLAAPGASSPPAQPGALFGPATSVTVGPASGEVVLTDVNRDGRVDLVTQHSMTDSINLLSGDGRGGFAPFPNAPWGPGHATSAIAVGDLNHDDVSDVAITARADRGEAVHVYLGDGRAGFTEVRGSPFVVGTAAQAFKPRLQILDVNGDKHPDIVSSNARRNSIELLLGDGRGGFSSGPVVRLEPGQPECSFAFADLDGDGRLDLIATGGTPGRLLVYRRGADGSFKASSAPPIAAPSGANLSSVADVNGDGRPDLILTDHADVTVLLNDADGTWKPMAGAPFRLGLTVFKVVVANVNADGHPDLVAATVNDRAEPYRARVAVLLGDGRTFTPAPGSPYPVGPGAYNVAAVDLNGDGRCDAVASSFEGDAVSVLLGR